MSKEALSATLQESLLALLCTDEKNASIIRQNAPPRLFDPDIRPIIHELYTFIDRYNKPPKAHTDEIFESVANKRGGEDNEDLWELLALIRDVKDDLNAQWAINRLDAFIRTQEIKQTIWDAADKLHGDVDDEIADEVSESLIDASRKRVASLDLGHSLSSEESMRFLTKSETDFLPLNITWLDHHEIGPTVGEMLLLSAIYGAGKSHFLVYCGKKAMMQRWNVLHITLEMSDDLVFQRYHQTLMGVAKFNEQIGRYDIKSNDYGSLEDLNWIRYSPEHHMEDPNIGDFLRKKKNQFGTMMDRLWVKQYPSNYLTPQKLDAYLDTLEHHAGFVPDIILIDYIDIMSTKAETKRHDISNNAQGLRRIAFERNCAVVTVGQLNRDAMKSKKKTGAHISEDIGKGREADEHLIYDQTDQEEKMGLARLSVDKARNAPGNKTMLLSQSYETGQFCLNSALFNASAKNILKGMSGDDYEDEDDDQSGFF